MRKVCLFMMTSLDGYFEGPNHDLSWHNVDAEFNDFAVQQLDAADMLLFGRATYEMMYSFWPTEQARKADPEVAGKMNGMDKLVFSGTLGEAAWEHTRLIRDDITEELTKLKNQPGQDLLVLGSSNLSVSLLQLGLLDELRFMVNPVVIGAGTPLFAGLKEHTRLKLTETRRFQSGNTLLTYRPVSTA